VAEAAGLAASVPLETATLAWRMRLDLENLARIANPLLHSDVTAAIHLALAAVQAAAANVRANLPLLGAERAREVEQQLQVIAPA
jgi:formiminotetrahydrofolate cyclodeaminase